MHGSGLGVKNIPYWVRTVEGSKLHLKSRRGRPLMKVFREDKSSCSGVYLGVLVEKQGVTNHSYNIDRSQYIISRPVF